MRSPSDVLEDIESDRLLREREIRLVDNIAARTSDEDERTILFRSLVLLTYAHLEGFCKFSLTTYAASINAARISCNEASTAILTLSLGKLFRALRDPSSKHPIFRNQLPHDVDLHMLWRDRTFIEDYDKLMTYPIEIRDDAVDTKSNLNATVLKRNLYQFGLDFPSIDKHGNSINMLLAVRNAIAHGDVLKRPKAEEIKLYTSAAFDVMKYIQDEIYAALSSEAYRMPPQNLEYDY